jgi:VWFA-related protein
MAELFVTAGGATVAATAGTPIAAAPSPKRPIAFLIFIDNLHLQMKTRDRALQAIIRFLNAHANDPLRVMVVRWNGSMRTKPLQDNAREIAKALPLLLSEPTLELIQVRERHRLMTLVDEIDPFIKEQALRSIMTYAESVRREAEDTVDALNASVNSLRGFDGRRVLVLISDGVPQMAGQELIQYWAARFGQIASRPDDLASTINLDAFRYDLSKTFLRAGEAANAAGVTFYTLDATGVGSEEVFAVDSAHFKGNRLNAPMMRDNRLGLMNYMAGVTGGTFIKDQNVFDAPLEAMGEDLRDYYSIGYHTPAGGNLHNIEVRMKRSGLRARSRRQYAVISPQQKIASQIESMFAGTSGDANPLGLVVKSAPLHGEGWMRTLSLSLRVPRQHLTPIGGGQVTLYLQAMDADGNTSPTRSVTRKVPESGDVLGFFELTMEPGSHAVVVGARDDLSGTLSLVRFDVKL